MKFIIEKNKETFYDTFVLHARPRNLEEQSMILSSKMQKLKQVQKGECKSGYATFGKKEGKSYLERSPDKSILRRQKKNYQALWGTIWLFKRRFWWVKK